MRLEKSISQSTVSPPELEIRNLGRGLYELVKNDNITTVTHEHDGLVETLFQCDKTILRTVIKNKDEAISALIRLRYSQDAEFATINKGIADATNQEYITYREYVEWCKVKSEEVVTNA